VDGVADGIGQALRLGLPPERAAALLKAAESQGLESPTLAILRQTIESVLKSDPPESPEEVTLPQLPADERSERGD
jgi:hypothetical protein